MKNNKIRLGGEVVVSDPCYEIPTWCQEVIKNVRPGVYDTEVEMSDQGDWGDRVKSLTVLHENIKSPNWEHYSNNIGVDSGQAGVFCMTSYRSNDDEWYEEICDLTVHEEQWGVYDTGVASSSGFGDGCYELQVCKMDGLIHGFKIIFIDDSYEEEYEDEFEMEDHD